MSSGKLTVKTSASGAAPTPAAGYGSYGIDGQEGYIIDDAGDVTKLGGGTKSVLTGVDVDMQGDVFKTKTLASNTVLTFSSPKVGAFVHLRIDSAAGESLTLPGTASVLTGSYDDTGVVNTIMILCVDAVTPVYEVTINQGT